jgi:GNAT superfamily N-acetyltransferase
MSGITVRPVVTAGDLKKFIKFQWVPYRNNPVWVPPLLMDRRKLLDKKKNPFFKHSEGEFFLAEKDGVVVGRIGAILNNNHNKQHNENIGFFGFFECVEDQAVAFALFDAAKAWLLAKGVDAIRGPASPSVNDEYGMLVEGFDRPPAIMMSYNPPYYPTFTEAYGFTKIKDLYTWFLRGEKVFTDKLIRISEAAKQRQGLVFRSLKMKDFDREVKTVHELYSKGWEANWGDVPLTDDEFDYMAADMKLVVNPELVVIAEVKGAPVGFGLSLPDYNMILIDNKRGWAIPAIVRILLFKKRITYARVVMLGVLPEYRNSGIGGVLFYETARRITGNGMPCGEASWVLEDNVMMNRGAQLLNGEITKKHRLYQLSLR